jgi:hypothetical protein
MMQRVTVAPALLQWMLFLCLATAAAQQLAPSVTVTGTVTQPLTLTVPDLAQMPRDSDHHQWRHRNTV